ncbi:BQ5605_C016g08158 [Microbotryum silenes-dioicae]|uniref:BQ5605_C016g08158 protein n=1 Tax=Microbotryum silenes-dioicae TaxID=796604 RepID=A0A2X0LVM8_9BASI|nr:BQ5605_C016g08158 [Microbotryum silenes-dioicae]
MDDAVGWLVALSFVYFTYRYFFGQRYVVPPASIDTVANMFPNIPRASIRYELERTRNNVEATVERCLSQGRLPEPPASFFADLSSENPPTTPQRPTPPASRAPAPTTPSTQASTSATPSPSLIQRLRLQDKIEPPTSSSAMSDQGKGKGKAVEEDDATFLGGSAEKVKIAPPVWETSAQAREKSLKERKERMVLEARRKLLAKDQAKKASAA